MEKLKITVTKADIRNGKCESETQCPIAHAARRIGLNRVRVDGDSIATGINARGKTYYDLPWKAKLFVLNFDMGKMVKPFTFVATLSKPSIPTYDVWLGEE